MPTINFALRDNKSQKETPISYLINYSNKEKFKGSTKLKIIPKYWKQSKNQVSKISHDENNKREKVNYKINQFKLFVEDKFLLYKDVNDFSEFKTLIKNDIDIYLGNKKTVKKKVKKVTFYAAIDKFIEQSKGRINEKRGTKLTQCTINEYKRTLKKLKEFEKDTNYTITFETINLDFYFGFKEYLEENDYALNTIGKYIKTVRTFMNYVNEQGFTNNLSYKSKLFKVPTELSEQIYLNEKELKKIIDLDLSDNPILNNARDLFIIGAYTGLRVSDFNNLTKDKINIYKGEKVFNLYVQKTGEYLSIPIHPIIETILTKYNNDLPKKMKTQDINDCLLEIGKLAGINKRVKSKITKGGKVIEKTQYKYERIKNHCSRRSFCTNAYIKGMPVLDIMAISGHKSLKTFMNYVKISIDDRAVKIANSSFFKT